MVTLADVVGTVDQIMGVKAVWGRLSRSVICFGSRGDEKTKPPAYFMQASRTAEKAIAQPYVITIGGGKHVRAGLDGHVLELVRVTGIYGETKAFVHDPEQYEHLAQWPVAVVVTEVYQIDGEPHLIDDLAFLDRTILSRAYDGVIRDDDNINSLWNALRDYNVHRRWDVPPLPNFRDSGRVEKRGLLYPSLFAASNEGQHVWKQMRVKERDSDLSRAVKEDNRTRNGGKHVCEACGFTDENSALFDAHHLEPLAKGPRYSFPDSFAVLCPTCHRWAHYKATDRLQPLSILEVRQMRGFSIK